MTYASLKNKDIDVFLGNWMPTMEGDIKAYREDGSVEPGNCVIDTNEVTLERTWRDQLERIRTNLLSELSDART